MSAFWKYLSAFISGYLAALLPLTSNGGFPDSRQLIAAIVPGLLATGLLHLHSPLGTPPASGPTQGTN